MPGMTRVGAQEERAGSGRRPLRLLVVMPSWVGDVVMATAALRELRDGLPGAFIGGLVRPGLEELLAGTRFFDEVHVERARGMMGPKRVAARVRGRMYDTALLLTNSFSTALITRLAFIPRRVGYDRDGRGLLLTDRLAPERDGRRFRCASAVDYYLRAARAVLGPAGGQGGRGAGEREPRLELGVTPAQETAGAEVLRRAGVGPGERYAVVNPGANDVAKRWPAERFGAVAAHLVARHGLKVLVNGAPAEADVCAEVVRAAGEGGRVVALPGLGTTIGSMKAVVRGAAVMVTNDTGPRHVAAAFGVPCVSLFGPTDPRWTTLPESGTPHEEVVADPTLPSEEVADNHPERCAIVKIGVDRVIGAVDRVLGG
jgi:heptosyltransferase-2